MLAISAGLSKMKADSSIVSQKVLIRFYIKLEIPNVLRVIPFTKLHVNILGDFFMVNFFPIKSM